MDIFERDILKWYNKSKYRRLGNDVSVTELMKPVRAVMLQNRHRPSVAATDLNNLLPSLLGQGLHDQLQRYLKDEDRVSGTWMIERRMLSIINGVRVSGRFDALQNEEILYDIKVTRSWKFEAQDYKEWETQLNCYDYMLHLDGIKVKQLNIVGVCVDWSAGLTYRPNYPQQRLLIIPITKWSREDQYNYLMDKVTIWKDALIKPDNQLPLCTPEERWAKAPTFKLYRAKGQARATKVFPTADRAKKYLKVCSKKNPDDWKDATIIKNHDDAWKRCDSWCDVAPFCNQYKLKKGP